MFSTSRRVLVAGALATAALGGCYVIPVAPDGTPIYPGVVTAAPGYYAPAVPAPAYATPGGPVPSTLQARLYPANEIASEDGMLSGTVTNMMTGKGLFRLDYKGEILSGEATRVSGDQRRGVANAYGQHGTYMTCDYRMNTPYQGTGTCKLSTGALYQVHIGG